MASLPQFSIIIPALNEAKYLPKLLQDLTDQSFQDFEVIIVDGGSRDKTIELAKAFDTKLKLSIYKSSRAHVCTQRNLGAQYATSKTLVFMDADNRLDSFFLIGLCYRLESDPADFATCWEKPKISNQRNNLITSAINLYTELDKNSKAPTFSEAMTIVTKEAFMAVGGFDENTYFSESKPLIREAKKLGYSYKIYRDPAYYFSFRRIKAYGIMPLISNIAKHEMSNLFGVTLTPSEIKKMYPMRGGSLFDQKITNKNRQRFIKNINRTLSKIKIKDKPLSLKTLKGQLSKLLEI